MGNTFSKRSNHFFETSVVNDATATELNLTRWFQVEQYVAFFPEKKLGSIWIKTRYDVEGSTRWWGFFLQKSRFQCLQGMFSLDFVGKAGYNRCITTVIDSWNRTWVTWVQAQRNIMSVMSMSIARNLWLNAVFDVVLKWFFWFFGETNVCGMRHFVYCHNLRLGHVEVFGAQLSCEKRDPGWLLGICWGWNFLASFVGIWMHHDFWIRIKTTRISWKASEFFFFFVAPSLFGLSRDSG